jgi:hypothetical protein
MVRRTRLRLRPVRGTGLGCRLRLGAAPASFPSGRWLCGRGFPRRRCVRLRVHVNHLRRRIHFLNDIAVDDVLFC